ncbi:MAG: acylneuraminate cytidylyltransferase family protein [Phycisphaerales bacterium]|nr:acylneuraminate cytidylyltransferase family protein [Phycisphaerales bacterium]
MNHRAIAIILARAGSKGLPRKNALPIAGRPCIEWTIDHAEQAATVGTIVLSTDDEELMDIGNRRGVTVIERPPDLASDTATIDAAACHGLAALGEALGIPRAHNRDAGEHRPLPASTPIVILYGNVPIRPAGLIDRAVRLLAESGADSVQSYAPVGKHHPWWTARVNAETGEVRPWEGDILNHGVFRRQDLPPAFIPDGGIIAVTREALMLEIPGVAPGPHAFFGREDRRKGVINREGEVIDIDTRTDLLVADAILREQAAAAVPAR